jgi:hypothetical protein
VQLLLREQRRTAVNAAERRESSLFRSLTPGLAVNLSIRFLAEPCSLRGRSVALRMMA